MIQRKETQLSYILITVYDCTVLSGRRGTGTRSTPERQVITRKAKSCPPKGFKWAGFGLPLYQCSFLEVAVRVDPLENCQSKQQSTKTLRKILNTLALKHIDALILSNPADIPQNILINSRSGLHTAQNRERILCWFLPKIWYAQHAFFSE